MHVAVLVPGIMGTRLFLPNGKGGASEEVWPPTPLETRTRYRRITKLRDPSVQPGELVDRVLCFSFYSIIKQQLEDLDFKRDGSEKRQVDFPYDWRRDLFETAKALADALDTHDAAGASRISLIGHSMGGLIVRLLLESDTYRDRPWFEKIDQFIALAVPHLGAPLALARIFGIDSTLGVSGDDFAAMANDERYPSGYQLLPAPSEAAVWNQASQNLASLDIYDAATAALLGMKPVLVARAAALHEVLGAGNCPAHVRYFYFAGVGHRTVTRVNVTLQGSGPVNHASSVKTRTRYAGDGTVPIYSALPQIGQRQLLRTEHATIFEGSAFRKVFFRLLGGHAGAAIEAARATARLEVVLSVEAPVVPIDEPIEVLLAVEDPSNAAAVTETELAPQTTALKGTLVLQEIDEKNKPIGEPRRTALDYRGPALDHLRLDLEPVERIGFYRLSFEGDIATHHSPVFSAAEI